MRARLEAVNGALGPGLYVHKRESLRLLVFPLGGSWDRVTLDNAFYSPILHVLLLASLFPHKGLIYSLCVGVRDSSDEGRLFDVEALGVDESAELLSL